MPASRYGWIIVAVCTLMLAITYGLMYSYAVFFKPLATHFGWDRATVSAVYSASLVIRGAISIGTGRLADRYGAAKVMAACGILLGTGLVLSGYVTTLWQLYLTYAVLFAAGLSGAFGIATAVTARWFTKNRGLALGLVSCGSGLGTLFIVPGAERLIDATDWSRAFVIIGLAGGILMFSTAFLLRSPPAALERTGPAERPVAIRAALRRPEMLLVLAAFTFVFFCTQIVMSHLVNYATDKGISPLVAASFISIIGVAGIAGRLIMGFGADKLGATGTMIICCALFFAPLTFLVFTNPLWSFYLFAVVFGFAYGGEVPLIPMFISKFFGTHSMAALTGLLIFVANIGGAFGPWLSGRIFDATQSYHWAFIIAAVAGLAALGLAFVLKAGEKGRPRGAAPAVRSSTQT